MRGVLESPRGAIPGSWMKAPVAAEPVTEAQRKLVRQRLAEYHANPNEPVATLADIKRDLGLL